VLAVGFREVRAAGSPASGSRHHSGYTSVGPPIPLGSQPCAPAAADIPAAPLGRAEATASNGQKQPEAAAQHRLGKATPLKKSFTPRPSRFRLEAERLSVTPPDKSSGLEKVLFRSPIKAERPPEQLQGNGKDDKVSCTGSGLVHEAAQPMEESCHAVKADEAQPSDMLVAESNKECSIVTPANQLQSGGQHAPQGIFAHMQVILDPELTAEENSRYVMKPPRPVAPSQTCCCLGLCTYTHSQSTASLVNQLDRYTISAWSPRTCFAIHIRACSKDTIQSLATACTDYC